MKQSFLWIASGNLLTGNPRQLKKRFRGTIGFRDLFLHAVGAPIRRPLQLDGRQAAPSTADSYFCNLSNGNGAREARRCTLRILLCTMGEGWVGDQFRGFGRMAASASISRWLSSAGVLLK